MDRGVFIGHVFFPSLAIPLDPYRAMVGEASYALWCHDLPRGKL